MHEQPAQPTLGYAHVPTMALSFALRAAFQDVPIGATLTRDCAFSHAFGKWVPAA